MKEKNGGTHPSTFELKDLIDDEQDQIVLSDTLFDAFDASSKNKSNYSKRKSWKLFKHIVCLYNDTIDDTKFRCSYISFKSC